ncbi:MAG: ATPase, T2SS/T4P/T4SS family [Thermoplasmata archaeon]
MFAKDQTWKPFFTSFWILGEPPDHLAETASYTVGRSRVRIFEPDNSPDFLYWLSPPSFEIEDELSLLWNVVDEIWSVPPANLDLGNFGQVRLYVRNRAGDLLALRLPRTMRKAERLTKARFLADVLVRNAVGLGVLEILLSDPNIQDIFLDAPCERVPVHLTVAHAGGDRFHQRCVSNILMDEGGLRNIISKLLLMSGRPFSERNPVLEMDLGGMNARLTAVRPPLSPDGIALALRRHSTDPWTLTKLVYHGSLTPLAAGLISFLIDGNATMLVTGSRGAGKSSLLGAMMFEFPTDQRILTIEDTLELPCAELRRLGYKVQSLYVGSDSSEGQMTTEEVLKVSLRLGESAIVLGEVRGKEARTLYEAMRVGTAGSAVLGTIHGSSSKSVYERVVHDLGIPPQSFSATDVVVVAGLLRPRGLRNPRRRIVEISELCKESYDGRFLQLMRYSVTQDSLIETDVLLSGSRKIREIADSWGMSYEEALSNIHIRAECKRYIVSLAKKFGRMLLSARFLSLANSVLLSLIEKGLSGEELLNRWKNWADVRSGYV